MEPIGSGVSKMSENDFSVEQYKQCYESFRHHDNLIWQIPALITSIGGTLTMAVFVLIYNFKIPLLLGGIIQVIAFALSFNLTSTLKKHRFFAQVEQRTLTKLELENGRVIQRVTDPLFKYDKDKPEFLENKQSMEDLYIYHLEPWDNVKFSAHNQLIRVCWLITLLFLAIATWLLAQGIIDQVTFLATLN